MKTYNDLEEANNSLRQELINSLVKIKFHDEYGNYDHEKTSIERLKFAYKYFIENFNYPYDSAYHLLDTESERPSYKILYPLESKQTEVTRINSRNMYALKTGVCDDFANEINLICKMFDIDYQDANDYAFCYHADRGIYFYTPHHWSEVTINGNVYVIDVIGGIITRDRLKKSGKYESISQCMDYCVTQKNSLVYKKDMRYIGNEAKEKIYHRLNSLKRTEEFKILNNILEDCIKEYGIDKTGINETNKFILADKFIRQYIEYYENSKYNDSSEHMHGNKHSFKKNIYNLDKYSLMTVSYMIEQLPLLDKAYDNDLMIDEIGMIFDKLGIDWEKVNGDRFHYEHDKKMYYKSACWLKISFNNEYYCFDPLAFFNNKDKSETFMRENKFLLKNLCYSTKEQAVALEKHIKFLNKKEKKNLTY